MIAEFKKFLTASNALALAVGVIIGAATGKLVSAVVADVLMPIITLLLPAGDWREAQLVLKSAKDAAGKETVTALKYGDLAGTFLDFVIISFVVFLIVRAMLPAPAAPPPTRTCPECLDTIPAAAKRCKSCGSALAA